LSRVIRAKAPPLVTRVPEQVVSRADVDAGHDRNVPRWLSDPMGPLVIRWSYLPTLAPWLIRFVRAGTPENVKAQARALRGLLELSVPRLCRW